MTETALRICVLIRFDELQVLGEEPRDELQIRRSEIMGVVKNLGEEVSRPTEGSCEADPRRRNGGMNLCLCGKGARTASSAVPYSGRVIP